MSSPEIFNEPTFKVLDLSAPAADYRNQHGSLSHTSDDDELFVALGEPSRDRLMAVAGHQDVIDSIAKLILEKGVSMRIMHLKQREKPNTTSHFKN